MATQVFVFVPPPSASGTYREDHPYGPGAGLFAPDLAIGINPGIPGSNTVLAVIKGLARWIPDPVPAKTGTLVLKPDPTVLSDLGSVLGRAPVVFVYRNLDAATTRTFFRPRISLLGDKAWLASDTLDGRTDKFMSGEYPVGVNGGEAVGTASTSGGAGGWARLGFELIFIPSGLGPFSSGVTGAGVGWNRLKEIIDPSKSLTRRLDPASFYAIAADSKVGVTLAPSHTGHLLFTLLTRRALLEIRDEYDMPSIGSVDVLDGGTGATTTYKVIKDYGGVITLATMKSGAEPTTVSYTVSRSNHVFTDLPSGAAAVRTPSKALKAPAHWAIESIFMEDVDDASNWFVANSTPLRRYTEHNSVTHIRDGVEIFRNFTEAMRTVTTADHYIYLLGWDMIDSFQLIDGDIESTMAFLTRSAADKKAEVRVMLWNNPKTALVAPFSNAAKVANINALPGKHGQAILDGDTLLRGSHHQKVLIVNGADGAYAFCGGADINTDRRDSSSHGALGAFHDVHAKLDGPAVADIYRSFVDRWNNHSSHPSPLPVKAPPFHSSPGSVYVQVARTYPPSKHYAFAPGGSLTPLNAIVRAVDRAKKFVYIEDQYLTPYPGTKPATATDDTLGVLKALQRALYKIDYLIIVIANHTDQPQCRYRRQQFIEGLLAVDASKVHVFYLGRSGSGSHPGKGEVATEGGCESCSGGKDWRKEIYCHAKSWIVDDVCVKIGSCNVNRRGYTHDSEMDVVMVDGALSNGGRAFARDFRLALWGEHLNLKGARKAELEDHKLALSYWLSPPEGAHIQPYKHNDDIGLNKSDFEWNQAVDPDGQ